jgi:isoleucyl-tRNA synthetase
VALELDISAELREEGLARDLLRLVQDARKAAGLAVTDRIELAVKAEDDLGRILEGHGSWIAREALALDVSVGEPDWEPAYRERADLDGVAVEIALRPVPS